MPGVIVANQTAHATPGSGAAAAILIALSACNPYARSYETRFVGTGGVISGVVGNMNVEYVNFRDYSASGPVPAAITWRASAEKLSSLAKP